MVESEKLPDDKYHEPYRLKNPATRNKLKKEITEAINDGLPVKNAFRLAGIPIATYHKWLRWYREDAEKGFTGTHLMCFLEDIAQAEDNLHRRLIKTGFGLADNGDPKLITYLLDKRFHYADKHKATVEVDTGEDTGINISIVGMTPTEADNDDDGEE